MPRSTPLLCGVLSFLLIACFHSAAFAQGAMTNGENHAASISAAGETDTWTFSATQGDSIVLSLGEVGANGPFFPWIRLQAPNSTQIGSASNPLVAQISVTAPSTGTYTVIVASDDTGHDDTGNYTLTLAKIPGAFTVPGGDEGGAMTNGANHTGTLHVGDLDMWTFTATLSDAISLSVGEVGGNATFFPWIRLFSPTGVELGSASNPLVAQIDVSAPATGTYTVIVNTNDTGHDDPGPYTLTLAKIPGAFTVPGGDEGGAMTNGANHTGTLHVGDLDMWTFTATLSDAISLSVGEVGGNATFFPWIRLFSPTGVELGSASNPLVAQINVSAPATGTYTVIVNTNDTGHDDPGPYTLTLAKTPGSYTVPGGDEGGAITNGPGSTGVIHIGDLDQWHFPAAQNAAISVTISEVGGNTAFFPWIRLRSPTGTQLGSQSGATTATINTTAPIGGIYTIVVATNDTGHDDPGNYLLSVTGASPPFTDDSLAPGLSVIKAAHITELRSRIDAQRIRFGLVGFQWTDTSLAGVTAKAVHVLELRSALQAAYTAAKRTPPAFTEPTLTSQSTVIKAVHITELRAAVLSLE